MLQSKTRWMIKKSDEEKKQKLVQQLNISPLVAGLLVNRGINSEEAARAFLFPEKQTFYDPFLLDGMERFVQRVKQAITEKEPILIFGDYDADGVTSTVIMLQTLQQLGAVVDFYIPNRFTEGYGPNKAAFQHAFEKGFRLIITVDTGIAALEEAAYAKELGIDLMITDHHEPGAVLPQAYAIIHPKLPQSAYPFRELSGAGVAFKCAHALYGFVPEQLLDIAVIGTVADLVSLQDENRLLVKKGLQKIRQTEHIGLKALCKQAGINDLSLVNEETIGFIVAPRLNAAGRLDSADPAVQLLVSEEPQEAEMIAEEIDELNKRRQEIVKKITEEAMEEVEKHFPPHDNAVLVIGKEGWNPGVIGIVASKLVEKYYRPVIILSYNHQKGLAKGSARSIAGFDIFQNLTKCKELLPHFGGHPMAAGMTLPLENVEELRRRLHHFATELLSDEDFLPLTYLDETVPLKEIDLKALEELNMLAPYGTDNPKPLVMIDHAQIASMRRIGADNTHLKVTLEQEGFTLNGVGFGLGPLYQQIAPGSPLSVIGELAINEWNNVRSPQLFVKDIKIDCWQLFDYRGLKRMERMKECIPAEDAQWVVFQKNHLALFEKILQEEKDRLCYMEDVKKPVLTGQDLVLADLPASKEQLRRLLEQIKPVRIYVHFYKENSDYFSTIPSREDFKWYYAFLAKKGTFDVRHLGTALAKHRGWSSDAVKFMSKVFFELEFVKIDNGFISLNKHANKHDLTESNTYRQKHAQYSLENELLYSSYEQLKKFFNACFQERDKTEEAEKEWT
ncbi:single-stranded-DNA-specific exonuclease RecJ [Bacillaceae bacterium Marseille-Q3522]|nr:single-stranded-DNA-specific exonuclease RecJ [Bacillaceae bacterium Marseille-Q3522]